MSGMYEDLKGPEIPEVLTKESILLLPIGAIEQHGPHLPLSVDHIIADETGRAVVEACGDEIDIWMLPTLSVPNPMSITGLPEQFHSDIKR